MQDQNKGQKKSDAQNALDELSALGEIVGKDDSSAKIYDRILDEQITEDPAEVFATLFFDVRSQILDTLSDE